MRRQAAASTSLLLGILTGAGAVFAQTPTAPEQLTVDQVVERAVGDNPELRAMRAEVDAARGRLRQAALRPNPMLDLGGQQNVAGPAHPLNPPVRPRPHHHGRGRGRVWTGPRR